MTCRPTLAALCLLAAGLAVGGCGEDDDAQAGIPMKAGATPPATRPSVEPPAIEDEALAVAPKAFVTLIGVDGEEERFEFPPAKLWLRVDEDQPGLVKARLFSDDPPEATDRDYAGSSFFFEMRLAVPPETSRRIGQRLADGGDIGPGDMNEAAWSFKAGETDAGPGASQISLGVAPGVVRTLKPDDLFVSLRPLPQGYVDVWLQGYFSEGDALADAAAPIPLGPTADPTVPPADEVRLVHVRAVLTAETVGAK